MKKTLITTLTLIAILFSSDLSAQKHKLTDAWFALKNNDYARAKQSIDEAYEHESTKGTAPMWYYRGLVYMQIAANAETDSVIRSLDSEAAYKSAEAFYYYLASTEKKKKSELYDAYENILYAGNFTLIRANYFYEKEQYATALKYFEMVYNLTLYDNNQRMKENGMTSNKILLSMYSAANEMKDKTASLKYLNMLIDNKYEDPKLFIFKAYAYFDSGDSAKGIATLSEGRELYPNDKNILTEEINYYLDHGQTDKLLLKFNEAIAAEPDNDSYYYFRGTLFHQKKVFELAEKDYLKAIELNPSNMDAKYNLGAMYVEQTVPIIDKMNANLTNFALYEQLEREKFALYEKALPYLEESYQSGQIESKKDKENILTILRDTYKFKKDREKLMLYQTELEDVKAGRK